MSGVPTSISSDVYFQGSYRTEVRDLLQFFKSSEVERDPEMVESAVKRVIAYMTLGIDVSPLFPQMIMASNTRNVVQKKMVYLYLSSYAESNPDLSLLSINTLRKDCDDHTPMIRGLALRTLSSLRLPHLVEYITPPILKGLQDYAPYVRKTAAMACSKLHNLVPQIVGPEIVNHLYDMVLDKDAAVVTNAIVSLNEILHESGGMVVSEDIAVHLMNILDEGGEWGKLVLLDALLKFKPAEKKIYDVMNMIDPHLNSGNLAVVMSSVQVLLRWTEDMQDILPQVYARVKVPLLTLAEGCITELQFTILKHVAVLAYRSETVFEDDYKAFYCRHNEPSYIKLVKLKVLRTIASVKNGAPIIEEVRHYFLDKDAEVADKAIDVVSSIGRKVEECHEAAMNAMYWAGGLQVPTVTASSFRAICDLIRRYPMYGESVVDHVRTNLFQVTQSSQSKASAAWILGEYGVDHLPDVPYIVNVMVENFVSEPPETKLQLLVATAKIFFKFPGETLPALKKVIKLGLRDANVTVQDKAILYYRLLIESVPTAQQVITGGEKGPVLLFPEEGNYELEDRIFEEFNSLSVVFDKSQEEWKKIEVGEDIPLDVEVDDVEPEEDFEVAIKSEEPLIELEGPTPELSEAPITAIPTGDFATMTVPNGQPMDFAPRTPAAPPPSKTPAPATPAGGAVETPPPAPRRTEIPAPSRSPARAPYSAPAAHGGAPSAVPSGGAASTAPAQFRLHKEPRMDQVEFQQLWTALPVGSQLSMRSSRIPDKETIESRMDTNSIFTLASGVIGAEMKFYFYAQDQYSGVYFLIEMIIETNEKVLSVVIKGEDKRVIPHFVDAFKRAL